MPSTVAGNGPESAGCHSGIVVLGISGCSAGWRRTKGLGGKFKNLDELCLSDGGAKDAETLCCGGDSSGLPTQTSQPNELKLPAPFFHEIYERE